MWRQLMYYVLFKSMRKALKGELSGWGVLKRTGNVNIKGSQKKSNSAIYIIVTLLIIAAIVFWVIKKWYM
jgi:hypothetical protein